MTQTEPIEVASSSPNVSPGRPGWERRWISLAGTVPLSIVVAHPLALIQTRLLSPGNGPAAVSVAAVIILMGLCGAVLRSARLRISVLLALGGVAIAVGQLPWGLAPLVLCAGSAVCWGGDNVALKLPSALDGCWHTRRRHSIGGLALAVFLVFQVSRLSIFMTDATATWGSAFPFVEKGVGHMCWSAYLHAAQLCADGAENIYHAGHYPNFGFTNAEAIVTPIRGLRKYLDDSFHYPPPFLLLPRLGLWLSNDYVLHRSVFFAAQICSFVAFGVVYARWVGGKSGRSVLWGGPLVLASLPTLFNFQFGQVHLLTVLVGLAAMLAFEKGRHATGGALLAWAIVSKVFPGLLLLFLIFRKQWKNVGWTLGVSLGLTLLSWAWFGSAPLVSFIDYVVPRLASGEAFSFVTDAYGIASNFSVPGTIWKLKWLIGVDADSWVSPVAWLYSLGLLALTWRGARLTLDRAGQLRLWLALLVLASMRSPYLPIYGVAPILWLFSLQAGETKGTKARWAMAVSWALVNGLPPMPNTTVMFVSFLAVHAIAMYWIMLPFRGQEVTGPVVLEVSVPGER